MCVFAGELLREAEKLVDMEKIHPQTIAAGFREAALAAHAALLRSSISHNVESQEFYDDLINMAKTTLGSKVLYHEKDIFAKLAVEAVLRLKGSHSLESIQVIKKLGGSLSDSFLDEGFILEKKFGVGQPKSIRVCSSPFPFARWLHKQTSCTSKHKLHKQTLAAQTN